MRILVTGSAGQLGSEVVRQLAGHDVIGLDLAVNGSVTDRALVDELVRGCDAIIHTASLHAPHVASHGKQAFIDVNITGTLNLLEAAVAHRVRRFIYTSTTSVFGEALVPRDRAVWVTEELVPVPRDIYDITKLAAEQLVATHPLSTITLRVSRFFDEEPRIRAIHRLYRGADVRDMAAAHVRALAVDTGGVFIISARSPFAPDDDLLGDAAGVIARRCPAVAAELARRGWALPASIDRVYCVDKAATELGFTPRYGIDDLLTAAGA